MTGRKNKKRFISGTAARRKIGWKSPKGIGAAYQRTERKRIKTKGTKHSPAKGERGRGKRKQQGRSCQLMEGFRWGGVLDAGKNETGEEQHDPESTENGKKRTLKAEGGARPRMKKGRQRAENRKNPGGGDPRGVGWDQTNKKVRKVVETVSSKKKTCTGNQRAIQVLRKESEEREKSGRGKGGSVKEKDSSLRQSVGRRKGGNWT